jgi:hypothetical protein
MCLQVLGTNQRARDGVSVLASNDWVMGVWRALAQRVLVLQIHCHVCKSLFRIGYLLLLSRSTHLLLLGVMAD